MQSFGGEAQMHVCFVDGFGRIDVLNHRSKFYIVLGWLAWCTWMACCIAGQYAICNALESEACRHGDCVSSKLCQKTL